MTSAHAPCAVCSTPGPVHPGPPREATVGTVLAVAESLAVVECRSGHRVPPAVAGAVTAAVREALPHADRRRLARTDRCARCRADLSMPVRRTERPVTVAEVAPLPVTTLRFDLPTTRCPDCGLDQVPTRSQDDLSATVEALFAP